MWSLTSNLLRDRMEDRIAPFNFSHRLLKTRILSEEQLAHLKNFRQLWSAEDDGKNEIEFWDEPLEQNQEILLRVAPSKLQDLEKALRGANVPYTTVTKNLQRYVLGKFLGNGEVKRDTLKL